MKANYTQLAVVLDRSGSMQRIAEATIAGYNKLIRDQKNEPGECSLFLAQFDDQYDVVYVGPVKDSPELNARTFVPRGSTGLWDAQGRTIVRVGRNLAALPEHERPSKVIVATFTDGMENCSTDFTQARIAEMVKEQREKYGWEFLYLGANQDAFKVAAAMNIPQGSTLNYCSQPQAMMQTMKAASNYVRRSRASGLTGQSTNFTDAERFAAISGEDINSVSADSDQ